MVRAAALPLNYPQLQNLIKRDPQSYRDDFIQQYSHYESSLEILKAQSCLPEAASSTDSFESLVTFMCHVVGFYPKDVDGPAFAKTLSDLLLEETVTPRMSSTLRRCLVQCLLLLVKRKLVSLDRVLPLFFKMLRIRDKGLRELLCASAVGEIRRANQPNKNNALNKSLQAFMFGVLSTRSRSSEDDCPEAMAALKSLQISIELYRRRVWDDARTVNVIAEASLSGISHKVTVTALNFFLGRFQGRGVKDGEDEDSAEPNFFEPEDSKSVRQTRENLKNLVHSMRVAGMSKAKAGKLKRVQAALKKKKGGNGEDEELDWDEEGGTVTKSKDKSGTFSPIQLLNDPQGFAEKLFNQLKHSNESFDTKLLIMNVISRVIGAHELLLLDFYSFLHRYIQPHQKDVSKILAYTAQASHALVPPDTLVPVVMAIANNFISDHCRAEVIAAGLNGLREICARAPLAMTSTLLQDLAQYKGYKDKSVMMAARSLIGLYRQKNPQLLHKRDWGKDVALSMRNPNNEKIEPVEYGQIKIHRTIPGLEDVQKSDAESDKEPSELEEEDIDSSEIESAGVSGDSEDEAGWSDFEEASLDEEDVEEEEDESQCELSANIEEKRSKHDSKALGNMALLATQKIFTPKDFARLRSKRTDSSNQKGSKKKSKTEADQSQQSSDGDDESDHEGGTKEYVDPRSIESLAKKPKSDYATRMASIKAGREGRLEYGSRRGKEGRGSTTNREKSKRKNAIMMAHKYAVKAKGKRSMVEKQKALTAHMKRQKSGKNQ